MPKGLVCEMVIFYHPCVKTKRNVRPGAGAGAGCGVSRLLVGTLGHTPLFSAHVLSSIR